MVQKKYNVLDCLVNAGFFSYLFTIYKFAAGFPGPCVTELNSNQAVYDVSASCHPLKLSHYKTNKPICVLLDGF